MRRLALGLVLLIAGCGGDQPAFEQPDAAASQVAERWYSAAIEQRDCGAATAVMVRDREAQVVCHRLAGGFRGRGIRRDGVAEVADECVLNINVTSPRYERRYMAGLEDRPCVRFRVVGREWSKRAAGGYDEAFTEGFVSVFLTLRTGGWRVYDASFGSHTMCGAGACPRIERDFEAAG